MNDKDLLKDQRGSPAYISPDVLSGNLPFPFYIASKGALYLLPCSTSYSTSCSTYCSTFCSTFIFQVTGRHCDRKTAYLQVRKLQKERMEIDPDTGEMVLKFQGKKVVLPPLKVTKKRRSMTLTMEQEQEMGEALARGAGHVEIARLLTKITGIVYKSQDALTRIKIYRSKHEV